MDVVSHIVETISQGVAIKANGPIEHWLTTLATGFWGFDDSKKRVWEGLRKGDVLVFQAGPPNRDYVEAFRSSQTFSGIIGAGIVERTSLKDDPRWLSEVIESKVLSNPRPKLWPYLVHFSHVVWFGNVDAIPAQAVQGLIEGCATRTLDLRAHIGNLALNNLTFNAMGAAGFNLSPMGTGGRIVSNSERLAELFKSQVRISTHRDYRTGDVVAVYDPVIADALDITEFRCVGTVSPAKRAPRTKVKAPTRKAGVKNKDYIQEAADNLKLGLLGERIVVASERKRVLDELGEEYASQVALVSVDEGDGLGYDIRTFRRGSSGVREHYLEVKTTLGGVSTEFFISENEVNFAAIHGEQFEIVRLYSLDLSRGEYCEYRLSAHELLGTQMTPVSYRVHVGVDADLVSGSAVPLSGQLQPLKTQNP
ncbi:hypothetical protein WP8S17C03_49530 [Metapseudomonas otitidis]|uniref:Protein NO VEIN C-terminal domain-containing protein n=1 Tax=Metapseudomonas otitidis TaxID=319939 RepID=A0A6S5S1I1_9GAMM|nr:DUF3883 domain-containing protein [Pseudomonas otitidis]BBT18904.1 hypothetical protein WP8S17C03_49530 [Pseudomonas otitidis]